MAFNSFYQNPYAMSYGANYATPNYSAVPQYNSPQMQQSIPQPQNSMSPVQQNIPMIYGKVVDGLDVVKSLDVPIGASFVLPKADGNSVFTKGWNVDGTTYIKEYQLVDQDNSEDNSIDLNEKLDGIYTSIDLLSKKIDKIKTSISPTATTKKRRVEEEEDE